MRLVYKTSGNEVKIGDICILHDGEVVTVSGIYKPHKPSSTGRVYVTFPDDTGVEYFPVVIDASWIEREDHV